MPGERDDRDQQQVNSIDQLRATLAAGFSFVRSRDKTASVASITLEESLNRAISDINEDESDIRPGKLSAIRALQESVTAAVEQARSMPASMFAHPPAQGAANTSLTGEGPDEIEHTIDSEDEEVGV